MAVTPITPNVPVDDYLNSSYRPEMEYVDGALVEHGMPTIAHGLLLTIVGAHFHVLRRQFRYAALMHPRTQIAERARYRVPDLMLCPLPLPKGKIVTSVPWVVIEILSPDDKFPEQFQRFRDYKQIGVRHMILLDPRNSWPSVSRMAPCSSHITPRSTWPLAPCPSTPMLYSANSWRNATKGARRRGRRLRLAAPSP
jgi:Uma2 family endonuclease